MDDPALERAPAPLSTLELLRVETAGGLEAVAITFAREGGESRERWRGLNLSRAVGDRPRAVEANRRRVQERMGAGAVQWLRQVHSSRVIPVEGSLDGEPRGDGAATRAVGLGLGVLHADCIALVLVDPEVPAVANLHCGWRGVAEGVVERGVELMVQGLGARPERLRAALSPAIGPCCYQFRGWRRELPGWMHAFVEQERLDLPAAVRQRLTGLGVAPERIAPPPACTRCDPRFFSHRRGDAGRNGTVILLREREVQPWHSRG